MRLSEIMKETVWLLLNERRVSYKRLQLEFELTDERLEALCHELIELKRVAIDQDGEFLVWAASAHEPLPEEPAAPRATPARSSGDTVKTPSPPAADAGAGERRPLTVMFCDLADSTALSTKLDPEDLQELIRLYQERSAAIVQEYEGYVAKYMGDGILVYFGYPKSLERNAERALRSALAIVEAIAELDSSIGQDKGVEIAVRIGVATGLVVVGEVVGEGLAQERAVIGEAPNIAARLQAIAPRNGIVIGALTRELAGSAFDYEDLGPQALKGIKGKVAASAVKGLKDEAAPETAETETEVRLPPLIGRDEEIGLLRRAWQSTKDEGRGQVVTVIGEAGIGKSVLVEGLSARVRADGLLRVIFRCSPYHTSSVLYPVIEHFKRLAGWRPDDTPEVRLSKLEAILKRYGQALEESVPLFIALLSLRLPVGRYPPLELTPQQQRQRTQDAIIAMTLEAAEREPLLQIWEDLHWADPSTLELLGLLIDQAPTAGLLIVLTARPDFSPPWPMRTHTTPITLNRLERPHSEALIARLAEMKPMPPEVVDHIVAKTDGVPLYVEELTKTVLASDILRDAGDRYELTGPLSSLSIPATLQESLMARLDRLPQVREIAQLGAVLGREFAYEMISGVSSVGEASLQKGLGQLVAAELLYQRGRPPNAKYIFKHALVQDAAYQSLLKRGRRQHHRRVAALLEGRFPDTVEAHPELLAHHFTEAGNSERAVDYWHKAGQLAASRSANIEAIDSLSKGLALLETLDETPEQLRQELDMQVALGAVLMAAKGYGAPEVEKAYARALKLCERLDERQQRLAVFRGLLLYRLLHGKTRRALEFAERLLAFAEASGDPAALMLAHYMIAIVLFHLGEQAAARPHFAEALAIYSPEKHAELALRYGIDLGVAARNYCAWHLWLSGYPDQAMARMDESFELNQEISHPYSHAHTLAFAAALHQLRREPQKVGKHAKEGIALATEQRYSLLQAITTGLHGWSLVQGGEAEAGNKQMREGFDAALTIGLLWRHYFMSLIAEGQDAKGDLEAALEAVSEGLRLNKETGDVFWAAELHRLQGELLLKRDHGKAKRAEQCFQHALELAARQGARSLQLRAAVSLARLWDRQGKSREARNLLAPVYEWFTEGFATPDLSQAKQVLEELSGHKVA